MRGAVAGAVVARNFDKIKEKVGPLKEKLLPLLATAGEAASDAYAAASRRVGEQLDAMQEAVAATGTGSESGALAPDAVDPGT